MMFGNKNCRATKGALILNLKEAKIPGVIRVDLSSLPFTHFHVRSGNEGSVLGYNDAEGKFTPLALFADRAAAENVLHKIEAELLRSSCEVRTWAVRIGAGLLAAVLFLMLISWIGGAVSSPRQAEMQDLSRAMPEGSGMPVDADSKFSGQ
jgi:hypothetical protein